MSDAVSPLSSLQQISDAIHIVEEAVPVVESALTTFSKAGSGDYLGAAAEGVATVKQAVQVANDAAPMAKQLGAAALDAAKAAATSHDIATVTAHVVSGGLIHMIEHEVGTLTAATRDRLSAFLHGIVHAASSFSAAKG